MIKSTRLKPGSAIFRDFRVFRSELLAEFINARLFCCARRGVGYACFRGGAMVGLPEQRLLFNTGDD
jgi:hypothetical protein